MAGMAFDTTTVDRDRGAGVMAVPV